jgi:5-methylcytosine-specific restriction endonuclease McrA
MYKPGQNVAMRARELTNEIEADIKNNQKDEYSPINEYDIIEAHILRILKYPECSICGTQRGTLACGHVHEITEPANEWSK